MHTRIRPNQITVISIAVGIVGGLLFSVGSYAATSAGALLFLFSTILDGCDGELARLTYRESRTGALLDVVGDNAPPHVDGFAEVASRMDASGVAAIEINLSCPNLDGVPYALDPVLSGDVVQAVRACTRLPISAKLSSDARPISAVAASVAEAGADWVVVSNTVMGAAIDPETRRPALSGLIGGYSGGPIRPIAVRSVLEIAKDVPGLPIVGCGGVSNGPHVVEFLLAGASAVAIGSIHFKTPRIAKSMTKDINRYMARHDVASVEQLIGAYEPW